jgi:mannose-6-phosphate isomerase-like protein (cupin superfamily)
VTDAFPYATHLNVLFGPLETIALDPLVAAVRDAWYNQTLVRVNESVVRLGVMQGEYHWHEHTEDDEFFFVLEGSFLIDLEPAADGVTPGRVVTLGPREGFVVPKGVRHRTRAPERAVILMIETAGIVPTGS